MALNNPSANPITRYYEAQAAATAEIVQAALSGMQRLQQITLQAMRVNANEPAGEHAARLQRESLQVFTDMNNAIAQASYSMMERMRDALGAGAVSMPSFAYGNESLANPMTMYDAGMRQWQTAVQQMMETPSVAMAVASAVEDEVATSTGAGPARKSKSATKRKTRGRRR